MPGFDLLNADAGGSSGILGNALNMDRGNASPSGILQTAGNAQAPGTGSFWSSDGGAGIALGGLQTLGSIWQSFQQMKLAKKSLKFQKEAFKTNLANSTKVYNTALEDRIRARYATEGRSEQADAKIEENKL